VLGLIGFGFFKVWTRQHEADEARRRAKSDAYDQREDDKTKGRLLREIDRNFPFPREPFPEGIESGARLDDAFIDALADVPGVELGTTFYGSPAKLPLVERRKHVYVVGTTGAGKTTLLLHIIKDGLETGRGVCVIGPEADFFRDWLLPLVPQWDGKQWKIVVRLDPAHARGGAAEARGGRPR
jgi:primosomal protein N'